MTWVLVSLALARDLDPAPPAVWWTGGSVYRSSRVHLGFRPAAFVDNEGDRGALEWGFGTTVQVTSL